MSSTKLIQEMPGKSLILSPGTTSDSAIIQYRDSNSKVVLHLLRRIISPRGTLGLISSSKGLWETIRGSRYSTQKEAAVLTRQLLPYCLHSTLGTAIANYCRGRSNPCSDSIIYGETVNKCHNLR